MRIAFVGHVCVDLNVVRGKTERLYGGGVTHGAITAARLGASALALTRAAEEDRRCFSYIEESGAELLWLPSERSTSIRNVYPTDNPDDRQSTLVSRAEPFALPDFERICCEAVHVNPLWFGEFPPELLAPLRRRVGWLSADAQGFLRHAEADGRMVYRDLDGKGELFGLLDLLKVDSREGMILTGKQRPREAAEALWTLGANVVLLTHKEGVCAFDGMEFHECAFEPYGLEGRTGRGDTCTAAFLVARERQPLGEALEVAAKVTSRKLQYQGAYRG
jgi:sugar/nucleoside kinase (ribokinase family)